MKTSENSMMLIHTTWSDHKTFRLIPITKEAPFIECIFDRSSKVLVVISKDTKTALHMLPTLDEGGAPVQILKGANAGKMKQERRQLEVFMEYYVENIEDVENLINSLCINPSFDWKQYLEDLPKEDSK